MPLRTLDPYAELLVALDEHQVRFAVLAPPTLLLDGILHGTVDMAIAVDIGAENMTALVQALAEPGYRFSGPLQPAVATGVPTEVVALTFTRRDRLNEDVHVVLAPPSGWQAVEEARSWQPFGDLSVPVVAWEVLLRLEDEKRTLAREPEPVAFSHGR